MCGRMWQTMNTNLLMRQASARGARNIGSYGGGTFNMGPTNVIPAIRRYNRFMDDVEEFNEEDEQDGEDNEEQQQQQENNEENQNQDKEQQDKKLQQDGDEEEQEQEEEEKKETEQKLVDNVEKLSNLKEGDRILDFLKWGHQGNKGLIINVRSEEAQSKPTFRPFINKNRCVVMAQGYYEWDSNKNPHSFKNKDNSTLLIAALYNNEENVMLLTREARGHLGKVHQRMPVILNENEVEKWLDCENYTFADVTKDILSRCTFIDNINIQKLGPHVNSIKEKGQKCLTSYEDYQKELDRTGIKRYFFVKKKDDKKEDEKKNPNVEKQAPK